MLSYLQPYLNYILYFIAFFLIFSFVFLYTRYNKFTKMLNGVKTDFSDIAVQIAKRASLIQNLADLVKQYATHENATFTQVAKARSMLDTSKTPKQAANADNMLTQTLRSLFMVSEAYPKLQASGNYKDLMQDLRNIETSIANYREEYNQTVLNYNNTVQTFPNNIAALIFDFQQAQLFEPTKKFEVENEKK